MQAEMGFKCPFTAMKWQIHLSFKSSAHLFSCTFLTINNLLKMSFFFWVQTCNYSTNNLLGQVGFGNYDCWLESGRNRFSGPKCNSTKDPLLICTTCSSSSSSGKIAVSINVTAGVSGVQFTRFVTNVYPPCIHSKKLIYVQIKKTLTSWPEALHRARY